MNGENKMKQRFTQKEIMQLRKAVERIRELASLERASFSINKEKDEEIKKDIRPYMMWFDSIAFGLEKVLDGNGDDLYNNFFE
jgi:hypothetical protein